MNNVPESQNGSIGKAELAPLTRRSSASADALGPYHDILMASDATAASPSMKRTISVRMLLRYKWSILAVFLALGAAGTFAVWTFIPAEYSATGIIEVAPATPKLLSGSVDMIPFYESYRSSQVDYIRSTKVLDRVLDNRDVQATNWYRGLPTTLVTRLLPPDPPRTRLLDGLEVTAPKGKQLLFIRMTTQTPGEGKTIVDTVLREYERYANERSYSDENALLRAIEDEINSRRLELSSLDQKMSELRERLGTGTPQELVNQQSLRVDKLEAQLRDAVMQHEVARRLLDDIEKQSGTASATQPAATARMEDDAEWRRLYADALKARKEYELGSLHYGETNPKLLKLKAEMDLADQQLKGRETQLSQPGAVAAGASAGGASQRALLDDSNPVALHARIRRLDIENELMARLVDEERAKFDGVSKTAEALTKLTTERDRAVETLQSLERRREEKEMNRRLLATTETVAATELSAENDKRLKVGAAVLAAALAVGVGVAFLRLKLSPTIDESDEVTRPASGVFLGRMPLSGDVESHALVENPVQSESIRLVRTALLHRLAMDDGRVVQITGIGPKAGKSTFASLLARSVASTGKRVLLIDADLRNPTLAGRFGVDAAPGLLDVLAATHSEQEGVRSTKFGKLFLVPVGRVATPADAELLANGVFAALVTKWRSEYDVVLIDSAPLLVAADAAILAQHTDGAIFVIREGHCRRDGLMEALAVLGAAGGRLLGTVFVGSDRSHTYPYSYAYKYDSESGKRHAAEAVAP